MPPIRESNIQFSGFKNPDTFQYRYLVKTKGTNEQDLQRQFLSSTTTLLHMSAPTPKKAISKDDYTLAHYLIFTKLVSAEADALKNLYLKIGSTSPSLRQANRQGA